ncbi:MULTISPECIES: sugar ABC transporter permease [unclassified Paenibacillus]|uniref:carbohydrate ABC transporter permease n=1 Tax=unclassified Paenibacillus TaxID=185978 RepID=UPI0009541DFF|nr:MULTISPECIES: sugar ABC transporter permease [unclassified Paenibacillus]ASS68045.1 sugar ABC transporter permease [Paenibacillus sp. RUD330]SIR40635.1 raffinose/stachyose/melibiose transport system permease protein [Paenibacillus sp. RU4X]SIR50798.1 raffinose/stachyose/melibiose transport system permease protein [Paenibacillus sp. RU4T]
MNVLKVPKLTIAVFVLPCLLLYVSMVFVPILFSVYNSTFQWDGLSSVKEFVGLENYRNILLNDPYFWPAVRRTLMYAVFSMVEIPVCLLFAILINRYVRKGNTLVSIYFMPVILSVVIIGQLWKTIYNPLDMGGMINGVLHFLGMDSSMKAWLSSPKFAMYCLYIVSLWQYFGYHLLIQFTGVQNIPADIYEAARIDGAEGFKADRYITLPLIVPVFKISIVLAFIGSLQAFDLIMVMTGGGPAHATDVISTLMYNNTFMSNKYGYGSALAIVLVIICLVFTVFINTIFKRVENKVS